MYPHVIVTTTFQGKPLNKKYFDEHPEIHSMYPSLEKFYKIFIPLQNRLAQLKEPQFLEIAENSIIVNGEKVN